MKILFLFFLLPLNILGQHNSLLEKNVAGVYTGFLYTTSSQLPYEIVISENKTSMTGYSLTVFKFDGKENIGVKKLNLKNKRGTITLEDGELIYDNYTTPPRRVKLFSTLSFNMKDTVMILSGTFVTKSMDYRSSNQNSYEGIIRLQKQTSFDQSKLIAKLDELSLLNGLSFFKPKPEEKNVTAIAQVPVEKINPPPVKEKEVTTTVTIKEIPPSIASIPKEKIETPQTSLEEKEVAVQPKDKEIATIPTPIKEKKSIPRTDPKPKQETTNATTAAVKKAQPKLEINNVVTVKEPAIEKKTPPVPGPDKKMVTVPAPLVKAPQPVIPSNTAANVDTRKTEIIRSVFFKTDSLVINLYDNGEIDGDTVSVVLNGKIIIAKEGLTAKAITKTIYITSDLGDSLQLVMYAENLGTLPPNTGLLTLQDGDDRYEIRFAGDFKKNSAIILRRRQ
jgi:hypothetical protein